MMDLYTLLVMNIAGGFWMSIAYLMVIFMILFAMGGVSFFSVIIFMGVFLFTMGLGYFVPSMVVFFVVAAFVYFGMEVIGFLERGGGQ